MRHELTSTVTLSRDGQLLGAVADEQQALAVALDDADALTTDAEYEIRKTVKFIVKRRIVGPDAPALGPVLTISSTALTVTLDRPATGPTTISRYELERLVGSTWTQIASGLDIFGSGMAYPDTGLSASTSYSYRCRAVDTTERASEYSYSSGTTSAGAVNQAPVWATVPTLSIQAGSSVDISGYCSDPEGDQLVFSKVSSTNPPTMTMSPDGVMTIGSATPEGAQSMVVKASDGALSANKTINLTVSVPATGNTFYIPTGSVEWNALTNGVAGGDTIVIRRGTGTRGALKIVGAQGNASADVHITNESGGLTTIQGSGSGGFYLVFEDCWYIDAHFDTWTQTEQGIDYGLLVTSATAGTQPSSFIKFNGLHHDIRLSNFKVDGKQTSFSTGGGGCGVQLYDQTYLRADYPGTFWHDILLENFYLRRTKGEAIYGGPNFNGGPLSLGLKDIEIRNFVIEDTGRECIQTKCWFEGSNSIHDFVVRRGGQNNTTEPAQLGGISNLDGQCDVYNGQIIDSGVYGLQYFTTGVQDNTAFNGYGPYPSFDSSVWNVVIANSGQRIASTGYGISVGAQAADRTEHNVTAFSCTIVNNAAAAVSFSGNAGVCSIKNSLLLGNPSTGYSHASNITTGAQAAIFTSVTNDDYSLIAPTSSAVSGTSGVDYSATDINGATRGQGGTQKDVGAYEYV